MQLINGSPPRDCQNVISQFRKDAGIERHITPRMLRHTVATLLLRNGVDIRMVQEFLGHASIATTQRYTRITKDHLVRVLREHHPSLAIRTASSANRTKVGCAPLLNEYSFSII